MKPHKPRFAFWHRYGPGDHIAAGGHAIPFVIKYMAEYCEIHYFGLRSCTPLPDALRQDVIVHALPCTMDRSSGWSKAWGTFAWYLALPFIALRCRLLNVSAVFMDETLPLTPLLAVLFFGRNVSITVADFFLNIYCDKKRWLRPLVSAIEKTDYATWRRLPLVFTKVKHTRKFLTSIGVAEDRIQTIYNPCNRKVYYPVDKTTAKTRFGLATTSVVLVHHGVLHPNKGNDRVIRALAELDSELGDWRFLLVGSGPELGRLRALTQDLGIAHRVIFTGWVKSEEEVNMALNAADIGLVMRIGQYSDDFHLTDTLVHEMACGLPILAARLQGISEVIREEDSGLLFDPNDMTEFKAKMKRLAKDCILRQRLGQRAYDIACAEFDVMGAANTMAHALLILAGVQAKDRDGIC